MRRNPLLAAIHALGVMLAAPFAGAVPPSPPSLAPVEQAAPRRRSGKTGAATIQRAAAKARNKARHAH